MNDELKILISGILNVSSTEKTIDEQLKLLSSKLDAIKLKVELDERTLSVFTKMGENVEKITQSLTGQKSAIKDVNNEANKLSKSVEVIQSKANNIKPLKVIDTATLTENQKLYNGLQDVVDEYSKIGKVKVTGENFDPATRKLKSFTLEIENAENKIEKMGFSLVKTLTKTDNGNSTIGEGFLQNRLTQIDQIAVKEKTRVKEVESIDRAHYQALKTEDEKKLAREKQYELAVQQNQKRELDFLNKREAMEIKIADIRRRFGADPNVTTQLNALEQTFKANTKTSINYNQVLKETELGLKRIITTADTTGSHVINLGEALKQALVKFPVWMLSSTIFFQSLHFFTKGIGYVNELNDALTQISIVTGKNQRQVNQLGLEYNKLAQKMNVTTKAIAEATVEFYRQGLSQSDVMERVKVATEFAKISNLEFKQSAEILTATTNSMGISIERAADVFAYLGDATATGADEIGRAYQKVGGSAGALGLSFEKVASWIAVVSSRTRESAETIGQSMKSILARVQSLRENGFDQEDGTQINQVAKALKEVGISLLDDQGQFRNFGTVMDEIGAKWSSLDSRTKAYIATTVAGTYQQSRFLNLMEGYQDTIPLYDKALQSAGTTTQKFGQYQEGVAAHIDHLKATMEGLWSNTFNTGSINGILDSLSSLVSGIDSLVKRFGLLPPVIFLVISAMFLLNKSFKEFIVGLVPSVIGGQGKITRYFTALAANIRYVGISATWSIGALAGLRVALTSLLASTGVGLVIAGISFALGKLITNSQKLREEQRQLEQQNKQIADSWTNQKDKINELVGSYEKLNNIKNSVGLDTEQEQKYKDIIEQLSTLMPNLVASIDNKGEAHLKNADAIREELKYARQLADIEKQKIVDAGQSTLDQDAENIEKKKKEISDLQARLGLLNRGLGGNFDEDIKKKIREIETQIVNAEHDLYSLTSTAKGNIDSITQSILSLAGIKLSDTVGKELSDIISKIDSDGINGKTQSFANMIKILENIKKMQSTFTSPNSQDLLGLPKSKVIENMEKGFYALAKATGVSDEQAKELLDTYLGIEDVVSNTDKSVIDFTKSFEELAKQFKESSDTLKPLNSALEAVTNNQSLSADTVADLILKYPQLASAVEKSGDAYTIQAKALELVRKTVLDTEIDKLRAEANMTDATVKNLAQRLKAYGIEIEAIKNLSDAMDGIAKIDNKTDKLDSRRFVSKAAQDYLDRADETKSQLKDYGQLLEQIKQLEDLLQGVGKSNKPNSPSSSSSFIDKIFVNLPLYKQQMDDLSSQVLSTSKKIDDLNYQIQLADKTNNLTEKIRLEKELNGLLSQRKEQYQKIADQLTQMQNKEITPEFDKNFKDFRKGRNFSDIPKVEVQGYINALDEQMNNLNNELGRASGDAVKQNLQKQIDALSRKKDLFNFFVQTFDDISKNIQDKITAIQSDTLANFDASSMIQSITDKIIQDQQSIRNSWLDLTKEIAKSVVDTYKKSQEALRDADMKSIQTMMDNEDKRHKQRMDDLDREDERFSEFVNNQLQLLDRGNATDDFNEQLAKLQKEAQDIQKKRDMAALDDSIESQARKLDLEKELADKQEEIEKLKKDRTRNLQKQTYQDLLDTKKKEIKANKDAEDQKYQDTKTIFDKLKDDRTNYWNNILNDDEAYTKMQQDIIDGNNEEILSSMGSFAVDIQSKMSIIGDSISQNLIQKISEAKKLLSSINYSVSGSKPVFYEPKDSVEAGNIALMKSVSDQWSPNAPNRKSLEDTAQVIGKSIGATYNATEGRWYKNGLPLYHGGGEVSGTSKSFGEWIKKKLDPNELMGILRKGEFIVNNPMDAISSLVRSFTPLNLGAVNLKQSAQPTINRFSFENLIRIDKVEKAADVNSIMNQFDREFKQRGFVMGK